MRIKGKLLKLDYENKNHQKVSREVAIEAIEKASEIYGLAFKDALCPLFVGSSSYNTSNTLDRCVGKVTSIYIDGDYMCYDAEIFNAQLADHIVTLIENGANLKTAITGYYDDDYENNCIRSIKIQNLTIGLFNTERDTNEYFIEFV